MPERIRDPQPRRSLSPLKPIAVLGLAALLSGLTGWMAPQSTWATATTTSAGNLPAGSNNTFLASPTTVVPKKPVVTIMQPSFNVQLGELWIESQPHTSLEARYVEQSPSKKRISFWILNAALPNGAVMTVPIEPDPIIKGIKLEPRVTEGVPAVQVSFDLYTSSPYVPFALMPLSQGLKVSVGKNPTSTTPYHERPAYTPPQPVQTAAAPQPVPSNNAPIAMMATTVVAAPAPAKIAANLPRTTTDVRPIAAVKPSTNHLALATPTAGPAHTAPVKPGSWIGNMGTKAIISDIYFDANALKLVSSGQPLAIKKQFSLFQPSRYVMDVSPAVLPSAKGLARVIPENNNGILSIRASQFEPDTVRIVVQFQKEAIPLSLNHSADRHVLSLQF